MPITSIPISGLNLLPAITSSDFIPLVQSSSMTTYRVPVSDFLTLISSSGTVPTASFAFNTPTASHALVYKPVYTFTRPLSQTVGNANEFCQVQTHLPTAYIISMQAGGDIVNEARLYLLTDCNNVPNGFSDTSPSLDNYSGFYDIKSLAGSYFIDKVGNAADYALEISQSSLPQITVNTLRIRTVKNPLGSGNNASASITIFSVYNIDPFSLSPTQGLAVAYPLYGAEIVSPNPHPAWPTAFIDVRQYQMMVSGTIIVQKGISGSLFGTASWAQNSVFANSSSFSISSSWASASLSSSTSRSSSWASASISASYVVGVASGSVANGVSFYGTASAAISASHAITSSYALTASFVQSSGGATSYYTVYPFITGIDFWATNDDYLNINLLGQRLTWGTWGGNYAQCAAFFNQSGPSPTYNNNWTLHNFDWDPTIGVYKLLVSGLTKQYWATPPLQNVRMFMDNRGGGAFYWYFKPSTTFNITVALSPTKTATYVYSPNTAPANTAVPAIGNYATSPMMINALRAPLGLDIISEADSLGTGIISSLNWASPFSIIYS